MTVITRAAVVLRLLAEIEAAFPGDQMEYDASVDDLDALRESLVDVLGDLREQINDEYIDHGQNQDEHEG